MKWTRLTGLVSLFLILAACSDPEVVGPEVADLETQAKASGPALSTLGPGAVLQETQELTINVVFVGYEEADIDTDAFMDLLPGTYRTVQRVPTFYSGVTFTGNDFVYDYNVLFADETFEDGFFGYLGGIGVEGDPTLYQQCYSGTAPEQPFCTNQTQNEAVITETLYIDAPTVEQWLIDNSPVDTTSYTVFFINWYGREDFQHHLYTKSDEGSIDVDTGQDFGLLHSRKLIAWGGTPNEEGHRVWFHDLSAGPESWTDNWNVDDGDLSGNGVVEYRMPPVWEYGTGGWWDDAANRPFGAHSLTTDLALLTRYVFLDLLATPSPLYDPALSPPELPDDIQVDVNLYDFAGAGATTLFDQGVIADELGALRPYNDFSVELDSVNITPRAEDVYNCFIADVSCFGGRLFGIAFADLFLYHSDHLIQYLDGDADYELPIFSFFDSEDLAAGGLLGYADDDWRTGVQSFVFAFTDPFLVLNGFGFTSTVVHESGHHLGLSHPHDGIDWEDGLEFGPSDAFYFAWAGDEVDSVMSYLTLSIHFSQFDRDNMARYMTLAHLNYANVILEAIYKSPRVNRVAEMLTDADDLAGAALLQYQEMNYVDAAITSEEAYRLVLEAADAINVKVEPQSWQADYKSKGKSGKFVDDVNDHMLRP